MNFYEVALVKSARSMSELLTYQHENNLPIGSIVILKVRSKDELGVVVNKVPRPTFKTKQIDALLDLTIDRKLLQLASWVSKYYRAPIGACIRLLVPTGINIKRRVAPVKKRTADTPAPSAILTKDQKSAIRKISDSTDTSLLYGVTGSGKTRVYIEIAKKALAEQKSTIVLVPEISLTTQLVEQFQEHFETVFVTHSHMTQSERHRIWQSIYDSTDPIVVIGPRSALFSPVKNLGLVVIDESHDDAYKQTNTPRYNTLKVARKLCDLNKAKLLMGSATPAITDFYLATQRDAIVKLPSPVKSVSGRKVSLIDMRSEKTASPFSKEALSRIERALASEEQVLIYHNRRGTSPVVVCSNCSWTASCPTCHIPMVLHHDEAQLRCHSCGRTQRLATSCPACAGTDIIHRGFGTKKIEAELTKLFPEATIARFDTDVKKADSLASRYSDVRSGKVDILIGTQMIAKGLDLPNLTTGIVVSADTGLSMPDFKTNEKVFQLLHQVIGRIGRHSKTSYVGIQTYSPDNPTIQMAIHQDYDGFYREALRERQASSYPPFKHLLLLTCTYSSRGNSQKTSQKAANEITDSFKKIEVIGPAPSFYERHGSKYRWQLLVKSSSRQILLDIAQLYASNPRWSVDVDPISLL